MIDSNDPEEDDHCIQQQQRMMNNSDTIEMSESKAEDRQDSFIEHDQIINPIPAKPMIKPHLLRRWFSKYYQSNHNIDDDIIPSQEGGGEGPTMRKLPNYQMYRTQYTSSRENRDTSPVQAGIHKFGQQLCDILKMRNTWRVLIFGFASFTIAMNWTASEMIMPPFLERRFGEDIPIHTIQSINLFGCLILPPIVASFTSGMEDFSIVMPGENANQMIESLLRKLDNCSQHITLFLMVHRTLDYGNEPYICCYVS